MKPFNLEEAKAGKPVCTLDGKDVRIICFDAAGDFPIVGLVTVDNDPNIESAAHFCINGKYFSDGREYASNLFMKSEIKKSVGYRRYLFLDCRDVPVVSMITESFDPRPVSNKPSFHHWIDTEWQYEGYEE